MTNEEAIEEIKILKEDYWVDDGYGHETKQYNDTMFALEMAIKALEQQPCDDAISRQAAIDAIVAGEPYDMEYNLKMIRQLPSVSTEKTGHWIIDGHHRRCTECNTYFCIEDSEGDKIPNDFCPHCGAKMEVEE